MEHFNDADTCEPSRMATQEEIEKAIEEASQRIAGSVLKVLTPSASLSEQQCGLFYAHGYMLYTRGQYLQALKIFGMLVQQDCSEAKYFKSLAACMQMLKQYQGAALAYANAYALDGNDSSILFYLAQCFLAVQRPTEGREAVEEFLKLSAPGENNMLRQRASLMLEALARQRATAEETRP